MRVHIMAGGNHFEIKHVKSNHFSATALELGRIASAASRGAVQAARKNGLSVTVLEGKRIVRIAPDGTRSFVKKLEPLCLSGSE